MRKVLWVIKVSVLFVVAAATVLITTVVMDDLAGFPPQFTALSLLIFLILSFGLLGFRTSNRRKSAATDIYIGKSEPAPSYQTQTIKTTLYRTGSPASTAGPAIPTADAAPTQATPQFSPSGATFRSALTIRHQPDRASRKTQRRVYNEAIS